MPTEILMPALSPTMEEGTLAKWLVKEGDAVTSGMVLCEIETDKATMEFEAVDEGTVGRILVAEGTAGVRVNDPIAVLVEEGEEMPSGTDAGADAKPASGKAPEAGKSSDGGPSDRATQDGSAGEAQQDWARDETETRAVQHSQAGMAADPAKAVSGDAAAGDKGEAPGGAARASGGQSTGDGPRLFASPLARRIAKERGIDLGSIKGSGPHGRIVKADVEGAEPAAAEAGTGAGAKAPATDATAGAKAPAMDRTVGVKADGEVVRAPTADAPKAPAPVPAAGMSAETVKKIFADRAFEEVTLDGMRRTIAARLTEAKQTIPHFYLRRDVQLDALMAFREQLNAQLHPRGVKLSVNDFIIKACANALQTVPGANAVWAGDRILRLKPSDVAVAVAVEGGLFTPVLRDAHAKSLSTLSAEMKDLAARAKTKKLAPHEYQGGSFAISNLGMMGIDNFDAVINPPHGSILAVGAGVKRPVVDAGGGIVVATVMSMTLSVDHRVIDGALGASFLKAVVENLTHPMAMLA